MAKKPTPQAEASTETGLEPQAQSAPVSFEEPVSTADLVAVVSDTPVITPEQMAALQHEATNEDTKRDFTLKVLAARAKRDEPEPPVPALAPRIAQQTADEMAAGRKMNEHHASLSARRAPAAPQDTGTKPVFRPADYVPDQKKGQGNVQAQNL